jgi:hypothetical protein
MSHLKLSPLLGPIALFFSVQSATAYEIEHGTHQHGNAQMNVVVEGSSVAAEFTSPLYNLVGFEHEARTPEEIALMQQQRQILATGEGVVLSTAAECHLLQAEVEMGEEIHEQHKEGEHEHEHEHDHDHDHDKKHDHAAHDHHDEEAHQDVRVNYLFECHKPEKLNQISIGWFQPFSNMTEIEVNLLNSQGAKVFKLNREQSVVTW